MSRPFLEVGPGPKKLGPQWDTLNVAGEPDIRHDARVVPYPIPSNRYALVYASHVLEHVPWYETVAVLAEWRRILRPGGRLEVWVPDFAKVVSAYLNPDNANRDGWWRHNPEHNPFLWVMGRLFNYAGSPYFGPPGEGKEDPNWHKAAFDHRHLVRCVQEAGFTPDTPPQLMHPRGTGNAHGRRNGRCGWIELGVGATKPEEAK